MARSMHAGAWSHSLVHADTNSMMYTLTTDFRGTLTVIVI
jgi:hypothetical protein